MDINFFGRNFWLITGLEYELIIKFIDYCQIDSENKDGGEYFRKMIPFVKDNNLFIGLTKNDDNNPPTILNIRFFFLFNSQYYSVNPSIRRCIKCQLLLSAVTVRDRDLYHGVKDINEAYQWGMSLPYITQCPHCGYDEDGKGLKYLAIFYNGEVITAL